jgi:hypothetical protein
LLKAISSSLGLEEDYLLSAFGGSDGISATMRANYYPRCPQPELTLGISAHSDPGGITLLLTDDNVEGTQVRKGDSWVTVQPIPGSFLVNIGDQIQVITGLFDFYQSDVIYIFNILSEVVTFSLYPTTFCPHEANCEINAILFASISQEDHIYCALGFLQRY